MAWLVATANAMAPWESIAILDFQASKECSGIGYRKVGTLGGLGLGGGKSGPMETGRDSVPITPRWSRKAVGSVAMSTVWSARPCGSQRVRWSIHDSMSGRWRGVKVGSIGPVHMW